MKKEERLTGITVVGGKGLGAAYFVGRGVEQPSAVSISRQDVGDQIMRFNEIREKAKKDYAQIAKRSDSAVTPTILQIYEHVLEDPSFVGQVVETISTKLYNLETSIRIVLNDLVKRFNAAGTPYLKERSSDIVEVCEKLISYLYNDDGRAKGFVEPVVLVVLRTFTPSDILSYDRSMIRAVISSSGGKTSHAAIIARAYSIPVVSGIRNIQESVFPGDQLFVDADKGVVIARPGAAVVSKVPRQRAWQEELDKLRTKWQRPVYTRDGIHVEVLANVSLPEDVEEANRFGADGIGLVRTEYLLSNRKSFPDEETQRSYYEKIFQGAGNKHCVIRIMDIGGDKVPEFFEMPPEFNPFMGWRAIRILLEMKDLFETQLSAIMKAGKKRDFSIMIPMVTTLQEWLEAKKTIVKVASSLGASMPKCGVLFEVPLAILEMNTFMKEIDFASIGTNDLIQYLSAADRNNSKVNNLYNPIEPAFLRIIKNAINVSKDNGKPLSICGEMAGNAFHSVLLLGMGLTRFSVIPRVIPVLKEIFSRVSFAEAAESVSHIDSLDSTEEVSKWLKGLHKRLLGDLLEKLP
ncbi:MAG TPA: phosphoenolpyruvate--protein phosphotransferase, partial [Chitinivibrionales bacterium]|nr:phosphoenolpyruvate--protein phosphotransferase [Chitinivibrionales bacterium]